MCTKLAIDTQSVKVTATLSGSLSQTSRESNLTTISRSPGGPNFLGIFFAQKFASKIHGDTRNPHTALGAGEMNKSSWSQSPEAEASQISPVWSGQRKPTIWGGYPSFDACLIKVRTTKRFQASAVPITSTAVMLGMVLSNPGKHFRGRRFSSLKSEVINTCCPRKGVEWVVSPERGVSGGTRH